MFTGDAGEVAFAFPDVIEQSGNNMGQLLSVLGIQDEVVLGVADTLAAAQGVGGEADEDEDQDMVYEDGHFVPLVGASSSNLMRIWWSGDGDGSDGTVA